MPNTNAQAEQGPSSLVDRREALLRILRLAGLSAGTAAAGYWLSTRAAKPREQLIVGARRDHTAAANPQFPDLAVIHGGTPAAMVQRALQELGGIERFISRADVVMVVAEEVRRRLGLNLRKFDDGFFLRGASFNALLLH